MRLLKCYLANDREGHFVTAGEAMSTPGQITLNVAACMSGQDKPVTGCHLRE